MDTLEIIREIDEEEKREIETAEQAKNKSSHLNPITAQKPQKEEFAKGW